MTLGRLVCCAVVGAGLVACHDGPSGPGTAQVVLLSPAGLDGAAVFEISGGQVSSASMTGGSVFLGPEGDIRRVIAVLHAAGTIAFTLTVDDLGVLPMVQVTEVADGENRLRPSLDGYRVTVEPVEDR
jgi:hypothetical protein